MRGIEGYRGVLAGGYAPMPLIPLTIAGRRKDAHTPNTLGHPMSAGTSIEQGPALRSRCRPGAALQHGQRPERQSADRQHTDDQAGRGGARQRPPGQGPRKV
jgi:hypothetical protein